MAFLDFEEMLFTTQFYAVNNTSYEYVFVELFNNAKLEIENFYKKTNWNKNDIVVFYDNTSDFAKNEIRNFIHVKQFNETFKKQIIKPTPENHTFLFYKNLGVVPIEGDST